MPKMTLFAVRVVRLVPPLATGKAVPEYVIANVPDVVIGLPDMLKMLGTVAATLVTVPLAAGVAQEGAPLVVAVRTWPVVPLAVATGAAPAPPPYTTPYCVSAPDDASVPDAVYARMPPEVPAVKPVPPLATGSAVPE